MHVLFRIRTKRRQTLQESSPDFLAGVSKSHFQASLWDRSWGLGWSVYRFSRCRGPSGGHWWSKMVSPASKCVLTAISHREPGGQSNPAKS